jgi:hypothetical protein
MVDYDYAIHSDFLIHWTGKDIDDAHDADWYDSPKYKMNVDVTDRYVRRVSEILEYGFWMTEENSFTFHFDDDDSVAVPSIYRTCFTELRLSLSMRHAKRYGRLGIGVKRPFLFDRFGRPLIYYGRHQQRHNDKFLRACAMELHDKKLLHFFKPMNSTSALNYDFYAESEWRIMQSDDLLSEKLIVDPKDSRNAREWGYYQSLTDNEQEKLKYLIPLDGWLAVIIYPGLEVKTAIRQNERVQNLVIGIKARDDNANRIEGGNLPIEMCLADTRNF